MLFSFLICLADCFQNTLNTTFTYILMLDAIKRTFFFTLALFYFFPPLFAQVFSSFYLYVCWEPSTRVARYQFQLGLNFVRLHWNPLPWLPTPKCLKCFSLKSLDPNFWENMLLCSYFRSHATVLLEAEFQSWKWRESKLYWYSGITISVKWCPNLFTS